MKISKGLVYKFLRFALVGTSGFIVDFSVTALVSYLLGVSLSIATGIGFCFGATSNYILNRLWTWRSKEEAVTREYLKFLLVSLIGLGVHYLVFLGWFSTFDFSFTVFDIIITPDWIAKIVATGVVMVWNFIANNFYTFRSQNNN